MITSSRTNGANDTGGSTSSGGDGAGGSAGGTDGTGGADGRSSAGRGRGPSGPIYSTRFKIVAAVAVTVAMTLLTIAYLVASDASEEPLGSGGSRDFVESLIPGNGSQALQQSTVGIDLTPGWQGVLRIEGQEIPQDQLAVNAALNQVTFTPGPGRVIESLRAGRTCVQALVWRSSSGRQNSERTVSWCFEVV